MLFPPFGRHKKNNIWVIGSRIYLSDKAYSRTTLISTPRDILKKRFVPPFFAQFYLCYSLIYISLITKKQFFIALALNIINKSIKKHTPCGVILNSTKDPFNRLVAKAARLNAVKVACIQHGLMSPSIEKDHNEDDIIDIYYALNENQSKIISRNININKVKLLSNSKIKQMNFTTVPVKHICLIGEDWERYGNISKKEIIIDFYNSIYKNTKNDNPKIKFFYRPHPSESYYQNLDSKISFLKADPDFFDLYIGFSSTYIWDMANEGKLCLQIYSKNICDLDFDKEEICHSIKLNDKSLDLVRKFIKSPFMKYEITKIDLSNTLVF
jgi:hypothetical protein